MTRKGKLALGLVLVLCVVLAVYALVPRSLTYASGIDPAQTERLEVYLLGIREDDNYHMTLTPEDPVFEELWEKLDSKGYVPMVSENIPEALHFPQGSHGTYLNYDVHLVFMQRDLEPGPHLISMDGWEGIYLNRWLYRTSGSLAFQQAVLDLLLEQELEEMPKA